MSSALVVQASDISFVYFIIFVLICSPLLFIINFYWVVCSK